MLLWIINIVYVLVAIAMIALILMQRGSGAAAGSGFGGGASATVFGARGASNFLSKSTKWLAVAFFSMTLGMAWMHMQNARKAGQGDLGVMANLPQETAAPTENAAPAIPAAPVAPVEAPAATTDAPQAEENSAEKSAQEG
ncbi:preprotein translocase subunit SecG [Lysobacteraceae bacterium NML120232]|nr:preprotein translocase subunit SecG [Xanthomonadaceae bacterium NML08-0793]PJK13405.1 preprotein translocase subunit SecG [Xanthomonadaceae bacterium NML120232]